MLLRARLLLQGIAAIALLGCASTPSVPPKPMLPVRCPSLAPEPTGAGLVTRFYSAFSRKDFHGMACCYHPEVEFADAIFGTLKGKRALAMWAMLTSGDGDLTLRVTDVRADPTRGGAHWDAYYNFPFLIFSNGVENKVDATFEFKDGKSLRHRDVFDLARWKEMAFWPLGGVISDSTIREGVQKKLDEFITAHPEFGEPAQPSR